MYVQFFVGMEKDNMSSVVFFSSVHLPSPHPPIQSCFFVVVKKGVAHPILSIYAPCIKGWQLKKQHSTAAVRLHQVY